MINKEIQLFVFHYKPETRIIEVPHYVHIWAGKNNSEIPTELLGDDTGENISEKNCYYSELTGIYWAWKNNSAEIFGACHYRRFFTAQPEPFFYKLKRLFYLPARLYKKRFGLIYTENTQLFAPKILKSEELKELLIHYDAILPQARKLKYTVETHFRRYHNAENLNLLESILTEKHPEYLEAFHKVLKGKRLYANNMFILKDEHFQEFMAWWFDVLFEFERRIDLNKYTDYQKRILGFIAERLLNVWFMKKQLNCIELQVIYFKRFKFE